MIAPYEPGLNGPLVSGVDVGGTKTSVVVIDDRDRILYEHVTPTDRSSLVGHIAGLVDDARRQLRQDIAAVGVAIPGHVDPEDGSVRMAVNLGITHLPLAIGRQADEMMAAGRSSVLSPHSSAADVFRASSAGEEVAVEITDRVADHLARAIRSLALTLGVKRVVIGGGVAAAGPALLEPLQSSIARERAASPLVHAALGDATVELLSPTEAPGARGTAAVARHRIGLPEREGVGER